MTVAITFRNTCYRYQAHTIPMDFVQANFPNGSFPRRILIVVEMNGELLDKVRIEAEEVYLINPYCG